MDILVKCRLMLKSVNRRRSTLCFLRALDPVAHAKVQNHVQIGMTAHLLTTNVQVPPHNPDGITFVSPPLMQLTVSRITTLVSFLANPSARHLCCRSICLV